MTRPVVPIEHLNRRLPELGRLKFGVKTERAMKAIPHWRVVSKHPDALGDIAGLYGGTVKDYSDPKSSLTHEVLTTSATLKVGIPTLGHDLIDVCYEQWGGGGLDRRCDGVTMARWQRGPDGPEMVDGACACGEAGELACDLKVRISFFLPGVNRFGVWRLETSSWNAQAEMVGMAELLQSLAARGITEADLRLDPRTEIRAGQTQKFIVPVIELGQGLEALAAGGGRMALGGGTAQIGAGAAVTGNGPGGPTPEIPAPEAGEPPPPEVVQGELVDSVPEAIDPDDYPDGWFELAGQGKAKATKAARKLTTDREWAVPASFDEISPAVALDIWAEVTA